MIVTAPDVGSAAASATTGTFSLLAPSFGAHFRAPVGDQLVGQADARRHAAECG